MKIKQKKTPKILRQFIKYFPKILLDIHVFRNVKQRIDGKVEF